MKEKQTKEKKPMNKKLKRALKIGIPVVLIGAIVIWVLTHGQKATFGYTDDMAQLRDLKTYHSFSGNITPVEEENVLPPAAGFQIKEVLFEEGDEVKKGDVLYQLDTTALTESYLELEASMESARISNDIAIQSAELAYNNYKSNLENNMNSSILSAESQVDTAYAQLVSAQRTFNNEVALNNEGLSQTMLSATSAVDTAYWSMISSQETYKLNDSSINNATMNNSGVSYENALESYEAAKINEENTLTKYFDSYVAAQNSYLNALDAYNAALTGSDQQLQEYALQLQKARAQADDSVNQLKLADLQRQIDDCTVTAPMDGVITKKQQDKGDVTISGSVMATVTNFDEMQVEIAINEYDILGVEIGKEVEIEVDALDMVYTGTISKIDKVATVNNGVSYFNATVEFVADESTRSGMSVEVRLTTNDLKQVLTVLTRSVQTRDDGSTYVLLKNGDESTSEVDVTCGVTNGTYTEILDGLSAGDVVLSKATNYYGMEVQGGAMY